MSTSASSTFATATERWLGLRLGSEFEQTVAVERGLPLSALQTLLRHGVLKHELFDTVISERTLRHRTLTGGNLTTAESDKAVRLARVLGQAERVFGSPEKALLWMRQAMHRFGGRTPMQMVSTEAGARLVEEMLIQIDEGIFA
jgi:putative toxin-antitoxin system antitoxin component (TIGR02293 family)